MKMGLLLWLLIAAVVMMGAVIGTLLAMAV